MDVIVKRLGRWDIHKSLGVYRKEGIHSYRIKLEVLCLRNCTCWEFPAACARGH